MSNLPRRPSLTSLRKQARSLLRRFREDSAEALTTIREHHPKPDQFSSLRDAQLVIARQYGFAGWAELRASVEKALDSERSIGELADLFADLACLCYSGEENVERRERAARLLAGSPHLTRASVYAAASAFDLAALRAHLAQDPSLANQAGGPRDWPPLMYVGYSRVPEASPDRDAVSAARLLLEHHADPRFYIDGGKGWGGWRWTTLTGVIGEGESGNIHQPPHPRARELAELLLDAGADPNDSQALYNCHFTPGDEWLELLLSRGLTAAAPVNPESEAEERTLDFLLSSAVRDGYVDRVSLLLQHGASASGRDDRYTRRTYVENAVLNGQGEILDLLIRHGAPRPALSPGDRFRMAVVRGDRNEAEQLLGEDRRLASQPDLLVHLAQKSRVESIRLLLDLGTDPNEMASNGRGALHEAAWAGNQEVIDLLLDRGARLEVRSRAHGGTAVGYAHHAGRFALRDALLDRSRDVFDLIAYNRLERLEAVLADEPERVHGVTDHGTTAMAFAREKGNAAAIEILTRYGAKD